MTGTNLERRPEPAPPTPMQTALAALRSPAFAGQIAQALPGGVSAERFVRVAATAIQTSPELVLADRDSLFASIVRCAQAGLLPDGREAAFVEVKVKGTKRVQFWPMVGGYRKLAAKHGIVLVADVVRDGDDFEWSRVPPRLEHRPRTDGDRGEILLAYCVSYRRDWQFAAAPTVMSVDEIERVRAVSRASDSEYGPWVQWWDRMAVKTVTRRHYAELPLVDLDELSTRVLEADNETAELELEPSRMTVDEANVHGAIGELAPPDGGVPDDTPPLADVRPDAAGLAGLERERADARRAADPPPPVVPPPPPGREERDDRAGVNADAPPESSPSKLFEPPAVRQDG